MKSSLRIAVFGALVGGILFSLFPDLSTVRALIVWLCGVLLYVFFIEKIIQKPKRDSLLDSVSDDLFLIKRELMLIPRSHHDWEYEDRKFDEHKELKTPFQRYEFYKIAIKELVLGRLDSDEAIMKLAQKRDEELNAQDFYPDDALEDYVKDLFEQRKKETERIIEIVTEKKLSRKEMVDPMVDRLKRMHEHRTPTRLLIRDYGDEIQRCAMLYNRISERYKAGEKDLLGADWRPTHYGVDEVTSLYMF
jgi:hypothetical protein